MKCRDALRLLYDVVDNEASETEITKVQEHIKGCHKCAARYEIERKFKDCIEKKGKFDPECQQLKVKITQQLDAIDNGTGGTDTLPSPFSES